jgi:purine-binding chemotaxis protein CheW
MNAAAREVAAPTHWVLFALAAGRYALPLASVERIVRAAEVTPLPLAPPVVLGVLDVGGRILPVFDLRQRFRLPRRPIGLNDEFVIARTASREVVLAVDGALGVVEYAAPPIAATALSPELGHLRGIISHPDGLVLIQDLEHLLSPAEADALDGALRAEDARRAT